MKHIASKISIAATLCCGALSLTNCANGPVTKMNAANVDRAQLAQDARVALNQLYRSNPAARRLGAQAMGIVVFPEITKGGFIVGGMGGNGVLIRPDGSIRDFYQTGGVSYGMQAGAQKYGYALFLMDASAFNNINNSSGWEIGAAPSLVVVDAGKAASLSTTTVNSGTYAFFFNQRGLMGGLGLQGSKITRLK